MLRGGAQGLQPDRVHQFPEAGRTEIEDRPGEVDRGMIVVQPRRHESVQRTGNRQLADARCAMKEEKLHPACLPRPA